MQISVSRLALGNALSSFTCPPSLTRQGSTTERLSSDSSSTFRTTVVTVTKRKRDARGSVSLNNQNRSEPLRDRSYEASALETMALSGVNVQRSAPSRPIDRSPHAPSNMCPHVLDESPVCLMHPALFAPGADMTTVICRTCKERAPPTTCNGSW